MARTHTHTHTPTLYISTGNLKMNKGFFIWNLPAQLTCPGSTAVCRKECYACKAEKQYPPVLPSRMRNLEASRADTFAADMIEALRVKARRSRTFKGFVRIHESGDFYSQAYLDAWKAIALALPDMRFLAFTKSFQLDYTGAPDNLLIVNSIMEDTGTLPVTDYPRAYAGDCRYNPATTFECPGRCDECGICWQLATLGLDVHFEMH